MKPLDDDIRGAIAWAQEEAEVNSALNGPRHCATKEARRVEVTLCRLAREAGYNLSEFEADND